MLGACESPLGLPSVPRATRRSWMQSSSAAAASSSISTAPSSGASRSPAAGTCLNAIRREISISPRLKEIAICTVAAVTGADYEFDHHAPEYVKAGGNEALVPKLRDPDRAATDPAFTDDERLAIRYAIAMTRTVQVPQPLFDEIRARFSETEIVELTASIACYNMVARILVALEVPE